MNSNFKDIIKSNIPKNISYFETDKGILINSDYYTILKLIKNKLKFDLLLTDPPYDYDYKEILNKFKRYYNNKNNNKNSFKFNKKFLCMLSEVSAGNHKIDNCKFYNFIKDYIIDYNIIIFGNKFDLRNYLKLMNENLVFYILCFIKTNPPPTCNGKMLSDIEYCIWHYLKTDKTGIKKGLKYDDYRCAMIDQTYRGEFFKEHKTIKPLWIIEKLLKISTDKNDLVLDCFIGSGTTAVACENLNRRWVGIEINKKYYELSIKRIKKHKSNLNNFIS